MEITRETAPRLIVVKADTSIDVHDAATGAFIHSLGTSTAFTPFTLSVID